MTDRPWPLCHQCCLALGAKPPRWPVTACKNTCVRCGKEAWIAAYTDYEWPNGDRAVWD
jgi:hypothetical protein